MSAPRPSEADVEARLVEYERAWLWNEATDDTLAGWGYHMGQMLYRLPRDGQTRDIQASIEAMLADLRSLAARDAEREREVAALRDGVDLVARSRDNHMARAEAAERALADLRNKAHVLAARMDRSRHRSCATELRALLPREDAAGGA